MHIVESWESPDSWAQPPGGSSGGTSQPAGSKTRDIHAYSSAPEAELLVNGKSLGSRSIVPMKQGPGSYAEWLNVTWETGTITVHAKDATGKVVATDTRHTLGAAAKLELTIDAPSKATGTGTCHPLLPTPTGRTSGPIRPMSASYHCLPVCNQFHHHCTDLPRTHCTSSQALPCC